MNGNPIIIAVLVVMCGRGAEIRAQSSPVFEVATVRPSNSPSQAISGMVGFRRGGQVSVRNITLKHLIYWAYNLRSYALAGGPDWLSSERYDVEARPPGPVAESEARLMLQALLAERFGLKVHRDRKMVQGFTLIAREQVKLQPARDVDSGGFFSIMSDKEMRGKAVNMSMLTRVLVETLRSPVEDKTGLTGVYDIELRWTPDDLASEAEPGVSIFTALKEQLGLELKPDKVPVDIIVIDHAERKPTEN